MVKSLIFKICPIIFLLILLDACKKTEQKSLLETRKSYLVGYGSFGTNWKLMSFTSESIPQVLTNSQLLFKKQYLENGKFSDTDGAIGNWTLPIADSLHEIYTNYPSGVQVKQSYFIQFLSYDSLSLTYLLNGKKVNASLTAGQAVWIDISTTGFTINTNATAVVSSTAYKWNYVVIQ